MRGAAAPRAGAAASRRGSGAGGLALGGLFVLLWASAFTAARVAVAEWPPLWALAIRFLAVLPLLLPVVVLRQRRGAGPRWPGRGDRGRLALMGLFGTAGYLAAAWMASARIPSGLVALLCATAPLFVAAGEVLVLRRRLAGAAWTGLGLGWAGVAVLGLGRAGGFGGAELSGIALALAGALSQAVGILAFAPARGRIDPWAANLGQAAVSALALLLGALALEGAPPAAAGAATAAAMAWSVLGVGVAGYALYFVMLRRLPPSTAAALQLLAPPLAAVLGWALLGEVLGWTDLAGGAITLAGLALLLRAAGRG
ncbi:DMT family transporter [Caldovatus aquaticus]|uniref:DMT family transporter n=1 Tax=Caldovatus aquaticus TaxID=2865671 RepID=UPI0034E27A4F